MLGASNLSAVLCLRHSSVLRSWDIVVADLGRGTTGAIVVGAGLEMSAAAAVEAGPEMSPHGMVNAIRVVIVGHTVRPLESRRTSEDHADVDELRRRVRKLEEVNKQLRHENLELMRQLVAMKENSKGEDGGPVSTHILGR